MANYEQNVWYQGGDDALALNEALRTAWSERPALRSAFASLDQFLAVNRVAFAAEAESTGKRFREIIGYFPVVENP
ncbi:MAG: hypothetical protein KG012_09395 [Deltaproteobacteria bacterium]|nr:hypothetical protein [Deltaproteobacteria bacterium]